MTESAIRSEQGADTASGARRRSGAGGPSRIPYNPLTSRERIPTVVVRDHDELARLVAVRIAEIIREANAAGRKAVLGLATGSTPIGVYRELVRMHRDEGLSFRNVISFNLDEYYPMERDSIHSYRRFMWENLFSQVDIDPDNVHLPSGDGPREQVAEAARRYEAAIRAAGGIDFQILGIGKTGHIGFNEPGSSRTSRTRLVHLDNVTRRDAAADFFGEDNVPRETITMGVATILEAKEIAILATGEHKSGIVKRAVEGEIDIEVAATYLQEHPGTTFYVDESAAAELTRVATPWLLDEVEWTEHMVIRAITWLSQATNCAILKLTHRHYAENKLSGLVARYGSPGDVNGMVFKKLGAKIRGRSLLPAGKRIVVFSPHPDDDVISMGGILRKLVQNDNEIVVAYQTSGNIAVFDHDVRRYVDFLVRLSKEWGVAMGEVSAICEKAVTFLDHKRPGEVDIPEIQDIKRIIRESEAVAGIRVLGLSNDHARFLNLPFYQTGKVRKDPIGPADVKIVRDLLEEFKPEFVFVAGDLSDPHGTHRMCKEAIDKAFDELYGANAPGGGRPEKWLYRGAWQEWSITDATWLVPMSGEELRLKIQAIFKHQSQKDSAPFPGLDDREFWQRVEARNTDTANTMNALGLAEYFAMEAYVIE